jgi:hypothetical protein
MSIKISELPNITLPDLITTSSTGVVPIVANTGTVTTTFKTTVSNVKSFIQTGNLNVSGAITANLTSTVANLIITGNLNVQGTTTTTSSQNLSTNSSIIDLHTFNSNLSPWTSDDGRDIGLRFFWYKAGAAGTSALVWENDSAYLTWYGTGVGNANTGTVSGTLGTMQLGQLLISNNTITTANATGALQVSGGTSVGGNLWVTSNTRLAGPTTMSSTVNIAGTVTMPNLFVNSTATFGSTVSAAAAATINQLTVNTTSILNGTTTVNNVNPSANANANIGSISNQFNTIFTRTVNANSIVVSANSTLNGTTTVSNILPSSNNTANIGSITSQFNTVFAMATSALYADLAEKYVADAVYIPGTVVIFGGTEEITVVSSFADVRVAGVISTDPAYLMNSGSAGTPVALRGKVPVRVAGPVVKGDLLVTSVHPGVAQAAPAVDVNPLAVFAKSIEEDNNTGERLIMAVVI